MKRRAYSFCFCAVPFCKPWCKRAVSLRYARPKSVTSDGFRVHQICAYLRGYFLALFSACFGAYFGAHRNIPRIANTRSITGSPSYPIAAHAARILLLTLSKSSFFSRYFLFSSESVGNVNTLQFICYLFLSAFLFRPLPPACL